MKLDSHQQNVLKTALDEASRRGASPRETKALVQALIVESGIRNLNHGDRDSLGPLQQRPSQGWKHPNNVRLAVADFLSSAKKANTGRGSAGQLAQRVQRSAFPGRYDQQSAAANSLLGQRGRSPQRGSTSSGTSARAASLPALGEGDPAVDELNRKKAIVSAYLGKRRPTSTLLHNGVLSQAPSSQGPVDQAVQQLVGGSTSQGAPTVSPRSQGRSSIPGGLGAVKSFDKLAASLGAPITARQELGHARGGDHDPQVRGATARDYGGSEAARKAMFDQITKKLGVKAKYGGKDINVTRNGVRYQVISRPHGTGPHLHIGMRKV